MSTPAWQTDINAITDLSEADQAAVVAMQHADLIRSQQVTSDASLRTAIGQRVQTLRDASTQAASFETSEASLAATIGVMDPTAITMQQVRDQIALLHTDNANVAATVKLALDAIADLATVVSNNL